MSGQINVSLTFASTEISKDILNLIIKQHAVIDKAICNSNAKDGMIHNIVDYMTQKFKHIKGAHSMYPVIIFLANSTIQLLLCSALASSQPHSVTKSLFYNPFQIISATFYYNSWM